MVDWDRGAYEETATELAPAAEHVVRQAQIEPGQDVLDLGTGTGNAALFAARAGANVTAVDPSERLLEVARERVGQGEFIKAQAEDLPFDAESFDRVLSLFAVIFSEQPEQAAQEIQRVLRPDGRALITAWEPVGAMSEALGILGKATSDAAGTPHRERFRWHELDAVCDLFGGATVEVERATLTFEAPSAEAYMQRFETRHPAGILFNDVLTRAGSYGDVRARALATFGDEEPLSVISTYLVFTVSPKRRLS